MRRLTATEIRRSISDVLLGGAAFEEPFQPDGGRHDFDNQFGGLNVTLRFAEDLQSAAERAAALFVPRLASALPCSSAAAMSGAMETACTGSFLDGVGRLIFRRPLTGEERAGLLALHAAARKHVDFAGSVGVLVEAMLQSPGFVFRTEFGRPAAAGTAVALLAPYELASALSYSLWRSAPDASLLDAAAGGALDTVTGIETQARRLLADSRARRGTEDFFLQWLEVSQIANGLEKADPAFTSTLKEAMHAETARFVAHVVWSPAGTLAQLLTSPATFANAELAALYGVTGPKGQALEPLALDPTRRAGFLTQPGLLAVHAPPSGTSPIFLGHFVRTKLLCQTLPQPPDNVPAPSKDPTLSTRQRFAMHSDSAACRGCHVRMDPIGFGFERYFNLGRYQETETVSGGSVALTGEGELTETDVDGSFHGPVALARKLSDSDMVGSCFLGQMLKFFLGRDAARPEHRLPVDEQVVGNLAGGAARADVKELMIALATSRSFLYRDATGLPAVGGP